MTLLGTVEDWENLQKRAERLLKYDCKSGYMKAWLNLLRPILNEFVNCFKAKPSIEFWEKICSWKKRGSGSPILSGWITTFCVFSEKGQWQGDLKTTSPWPSIDESDIPSGQVKVAVKVDDNGTEHNCEIIAGHNRIILVNKHTLQPGLGWILQKIQPQEKGK